MIRRAKRLNEHSIVAVVGCYAQTASEEVSKIEGVNLIIGTKDRSRIIELINQLNEQRRQINAVDNIMRTREFEDMKVTSYKGKTRAFLKIQEGCNQFCSYCIIPYARGPVRSRRPEDILEEVKRLAQNGFKEIVFAGIHVASYGKDLKNTSLLKIISQVHEIEGIERLRLSSVEPMTINEEFVQLAKQLPKLCPHYHVSLQSGCDETLKRMNRKYSTSDYRQVVERLRRNFPDVAITTDIMVGFPGETQEEFEKSLRFVKEMEFSQAHVFKYSKRKGTPAASMPDQVPPAEKERRSKQMLELVHGSQRLFFEKNIGKEMEVLFEQPVKEKEGFYEGLTPNYIPVIVQSKDNIEGKIFKVRLESIENNHVLGTLIGGQYS